MTPSSAYVPVAQTLRSEYVESIHFGAVVALDRGGSVAFAAGDPTVEVYPRSSNKPMQALAMVECGLALAPDLLAVACSSHDGSPEHLAAVRNVLGGVGLTESALQNTADYPIDEACAHQVIRAGGTKSSLQQNCSGKHSAMLATCVINGWPIQRYLDQTHPVQQAITNRLQAMTACGVVHIGVDGCGAPAHVFALSSLASALRQIAIGDAGPAGDAVYRAMTTHPAMVGGPTRDVTRLMQAVPGLVAKDGAEGVFVAALPDGRAVALKIADGAHRARPALMVAALSRLGVDVVDETFLPGAVQVIATFVP